MPYYCSPTKEIRVADLFDGRLAGHNVYEVIVPPERQRSGTSDRSRCLIDASNGGGVTVYHDGTYVAEFMTPYSGRAHRILAVISKEFDAEVESDPDPNGVDCDPAVDNPDGSP